SQNLHPNNSPDLFKSDTGDDRLPQNPVGGGVGKYDKVELTTSYRASTWALASQHRFWVLKGNASIKFNGRTAREELLYSAGVIGDERR
ncbi:hypothetical protein, partial [Thiolapillus sp.]|uniref:hypothetical protein n=1 Tax=Thiolapillus sp. TaxID=2017437 RepID=UPI003AF7A940